ncbi:MAG: type II toxin-antitoxin system YhaV family toxin [Elusimicrobia bacterium]|nr:type II toxin-antitoxin system YhaV family toxin [Elusimicrobiota bacterium]
MTKSKFLVRYHELYYQRIQELKDRVRELKAQLSPEDFARHETVELAVRIRNAESEGEEDPARPEYLLHDELRKFRRYKRGLGRYRLIFCFSNKPPIIVFLYLNTADALRKAGSRLDPYEQFKALLRRGATSSDPADPRTKKWIAKQESGE